ncbi:hypothetical protein BDN67DRAFT_984412 [Paxillus ammoniavirescens]|nr:hypothetical protein BDN67DRAFT_984412 [Paxillus ammoniavirescens]
MYAAVQIYYTMSTEKLWTSMISTVNLADMFYAMVDLVKQKSDKQWAPGLVLGGPSKHHKTVVNPGNSNSEDDLADFEDDPPSLNVRQHCVIARPPTRSGPAHDNDNNNHDGNNLHNGDAGANNNTEPEENASSTGRNTSVVGTDPSNMPAHHNNATGLQQERVMSLLTPPGSPPPDGPGTLLPALDLPLLPTSPAVFVKLH